MHGRIISDAIGQRDRRNVRLLRNGIESVPLRSTLKLKLKFSRFTLTAATAYYHHQFRISADLSLTSRYFIFVEFQNFSILQQLIYLNKICD